MSVQCAFRTLCFPAPAPVQMPFRLGFANKKCSFFSQNFTEQKFQANKNWEMGHFSDPGGGGGEMAEVLRHGHTHGDHGGVMIGRQTHRHRDRQSDTHTMRKTDRHRQTHWTDRQTDRQTDRHIWTDSHI